jgi:hypothetical protein
MRQRRRPTPRNVARVLGADPDKLRHFVEFHPDPSAEALLAATDTDADALDRADRELIAEWVADRLEDRFSADAVRAVFKKHGTVPPGEVGDLVDHYDPNRLVSCTVRQLRETGEITAVKNEFGITTGYRLADADDTDGGE